jgi:hypothetical protein
VGAVNTYDEDGRVLEQRSPFGRRTYISYLPGRVTVTTDDDEDGPVNTSSTTLPGGCWRSSTATTGSSRWRMTTGATLFR